MKASRLVLIMALLLTFGAFSMTSFSTLVGAEKGAPVDDDSKVETEDEVFEEGQAEPGTAGSGKPGEGAEDAPPSETQKVIGPASDVETSYLFTDNSDEAMPAGKIVKCLVSVRNTGENKKAYLIDSIAASLRYPMDYSYYLQNFTKLPINRTVEVNREATFSYSFHTSDHFSGRPFGIVVEVNYNDNEETYMSTAFNKTVQMVEVDDAFDAEAIMLYLLGFSVIGLVVVLGYYYTSGGNKGTGKGKGKKTKLETGTANGHVYDEWLPAHVRKSPKAAPKPAPKKIKKDQ